MKKNNLELAWGSIVAALRAAGAKLNWTPLALDLLDRCVRAHARAMV